MKTSVLLPASVLSVLGAFAQQSCRQPLELACNAPAMALVADLAEQVTSTTSIPVTVQPLDDTAAADATLIVLPGQSERAPAGAERIAIGGLVFVAHPHRGLTQLSTEQVGSLLRGSITNWRQLGGPDAEIRLVVADQVVETVLREHWQVPAATTLRTAGSDRRCQNAVADDPFAIGCMSAGVAEAAITAGLPLQVLALDGVKATPETVLRQTYPLCQSLFLLLAPMAHSHQRLLLEELGAQPAQALLRRHGFVPLANN